MSNTRPNLGLSITVDATQSLQRLNTLIAKINELKTLAASGVNFDVNLGNVVTEASKALVNARQEFGKLKLAIEQTDKAMGGLDGKDILNSIKNINSAMVDAQAQIKQVYASVGSEARKATSEQNKLLREQKKMSMEGAGQMVGERKRPQQMSHLGDSGKLYSNYADKSLIRQIERNYEAIDLKDKNTVKNIKGRWDELTNTLKTKGVEDISKFLSPNEFAKAFTEYKTISNKLGYKQDELITGGGIEKAYRRYFDNAFQISSVGNSLTKFSQADDAVNFLKLFNSYKDILKAAHSVASEYGIGLNAFKPIIESMGDAKSQKKFLQQSLPSLKSAKDNIDWDKMLYGKGKDVMEVNITALQQTVKAFNTAIEQIIVGVNKLKTAAASIGVVAEDAAAKAPSTAKTEITKPIQIQKDPTEELMRKRDALIKSMEDTTVLPRKTSYDSRIKKLEELNGKLASIENGSMPKQYPSNFFSQSKYGENYYKEYIKEASGFNALQKEMNSLIEQGIVPTKARWQVEKERLDGIKNSILGTKSAGLNKQFLSELGDPTGGSYENFVNMIKNHHGTNNLASSIKLNTSEVNGQITQIVEKLEALKAKGNIPINFNLTSFNEAVARVNATIANLRQNGSEIPLRANTATLMTQLSRIVEMGSRVQLPITLTVANGKSVIAEIETVLAKSKEISNLAIAVPIKAELTTFYKDLENVKVKLEEFYASKKLFNPKLIADISDFNNKLKVLKNNLIQFQRAKYTTIKIKADLGAFKKAMADFVTSINSNGLSQGKTVTITADNKQFLAVVDESLKKLQELKDVTVHINSNVKDVISKTKETSEAKTKAKEPDQLAWDILEAEWESPKALTHAQYLSKRKAQIDTGVEGGHYVEREYEEYKKVSDAYIASLEEARKQKDLETKQMKKANSEQVKAESKAKADAQKSEGVTELTPFMEWAVRNRGYNAQSFYDGTLSEKDLVRQLRQDNDIEAKLMRQKFKGQSRMAKEFVQERIQQEKEYTAAYEYEVNTRSAISMTQTKQREADAARTLKNQVNEKFKLEGDLQNQNSKNMSFADAQRKKQEEQAKREAQAHKENLQFLDKEAKAKELYNQLLEKQNRLLTYGKTLTQKQVDAQRDKLVKARTSMENMGFDTSDLRKSNMELLGWDKNTINRAITDYNTQSWNKNDIQSYSNTMSQLRRDQELYFNAMSKYPSKENIANLATVTARIKSMNQEMAKFTNYTSKSDKALDSLKNKFSNHLSWMTSGMLIGSAFAIPAEAISSMQELEYELAGVRQVVPEIERSEEKAYAMGNELVNIARTYGVSVHEAMDAAKSIGRMYGKDAIDENGNAIKGSGVANTNLITSQAAKMAVADAFSMEGAFKGLEAALSQWNLQTENTSELLVNTNRILEAWTITAHAGAASAQDIGQAIEIAGTAAHSAGISFEFFNALVATGVRQTARSGNEIGQAIKSMMVSMQSDKSLKALQEWGIEIYNIGEDGTKSMRSFEDIILDVSLMMNNTEKDTRRLLMTLSGGRPILASRSGNVA